MLALRLFLGLVMDRSGTRGVVLGLGSVSTEIVLGLGRDHS